jgi:hypothetical protein
MSAHLALTEEGTGIGVTSFDVDTVTMTVDGTVVGTSFDGIITTEG